MRRRSVQSGPPYERRPTAEGFGVLNAAAVWFNCPRLSSPESRRAPRILIPVELSRANAQERFVVEYSGEEIGDNLSLVEKLKAEFGIKLPLMGDPEELDRET